MIMKWIQRDVKLPNESSNTVSLRKAFCAKSDLTSCQRPWTLTNSNASGLRYIFL